MESPATDHQNHGRRRLCVSAVLSLWMQRTKLQASRMGDYPKSHSRQHPGDVMDAEKVIHLIQGSGWTVVPAYRFPRGAAFACARAYAYSRCLGEHFGALAVGQSPPVVANHKWPQDRAKCCINSETIRARTGALWPIMTPNAEVTTKGTGFLVVCKPPPFQLKGIAESTCLE